MIEDKECANCGSRKNCGAIYKKMGEYQGPSVLVKVFLAFILPLLVFIGSLILFEKVFLSSVRDDKLRTILNFGIAAGITLGVIFAVRLSTRRRRTKNGV